MSEGLHTDLPVISFHTVLYCRKWSECVSFYKVTLGFPVIFSNNIFVEFQPAPGSRIGLLDAAKSSRPAGTHDNYLLSFCVTDVEKTHAILQARCSGLSEVKDHAWGARVFELKDPEGRRLEFWSPTL